MAAVALLRHGHRRPVVAPCIPLLRFHQQRLQQVPVARRPSSAAALQSARGGTAPAPISPACLTAVVAAPLASDCTPAQRRLLCGAVLALLRALATDEGSASLNSGGGGGDGDGSEYQPAKQRCEWRWWWRRRIWWQLLCILVCAVVDTCVAATWRLAGRGCAVVATNAPRDDNDSDSDDNNNGSGSVSSIDGSDGGGGAGMSILAVLDAGRRADTEYKRALGALCRRCLRTLLARAYSDLPADECAARVVKRMEPVEGILALYSLLERATVTRWVAIASTTYQYSIASRILVLAWLPAMCNPAAAECRHGRGSTHSTHHRVCSATMCLLQLL